MAFFVNSLLSRPLLEAFALQYCLPFAHLLLHKSPHFERQTKQCDKALGILVVIQLTGSEGSDALIVEAVL